MKYSITTLPKYVINFFFVLGIVGAISFRILIFTDRIDPSLTKVVWYIGVLGYLFFFMYRYYISKKRRAVIEESKILQKISDGEKLSQDDIAVAKYIFGSILKSKENINYLVIFILSFVVIFMDLFL